MAEILASEVAPMEVEQQLEVLCASQYLHLGPWPFATTKKDANV